jgi:3-isopropylmalate/(R)-2-methylmalate dehydratase small subunit
MHSQSEIQNQKSKISGKVWKYGDGVNTDVLFPGKHTYTLREPEEIAAHALEDLDPNFTAHARPGDIIVAGRNFGNGSSREQAVTCLKYRGLAAVVAKSFARIYFRNGINQGLLLITCPEAVDAARSGDTLAIDLARSLIRLDGREYAFPPLSPTALGMIEAGGLIAHVRRKLGLTSTDDVKISD